MADRIVKAILKGMERAFDDHYLHSRTSGEGEQRRAHRSPEYLYTVYIARQIMDINNGPYLDIEDPVERAVLDAGGWGSGAIPPDARRHGTFDIVLSNGTGPSAVIEVKCSHAMTDPVKRDIVRICRVLNRRNNIRYGLLGLLVSGQGRNANGEISYGHRETRVLAIKTRAQEIVEKYGNNLRVTSRESLLTGNEQQEYAAMAFKIRR